MTTLQHELTMRAGDAVWNPLTGEKSLVVESATESGGARILVDFAVEAAGFVPGGEHVHDHCDEHLEVRAGRIACVLDGVQHTLRGGDEITFPRGSWHSWWNAGPDEVRIRARIEPALRFEQAILVLWGLCADGRTDAQGRPSPLLGALLATRFRRELRFRQPPAAVQRLLFGPLAALARRRGLERSLDRYLDPATHPSAEPGLGRLPERVMAPVRLARLEP
jgi:mannose-6-phosphate isomerase-like protein (cupin superfamily)